jgi:hypothetical protein
MFLIEIIIQKYIKKIVNNCFTYFFKNKNKIIPVEPENEAMILEYSLIQSSANINEESSENINLIE